MSNAKLGLLTAVVVVIAVYLGFAKDVPFVNEPYRIKAAFNNSAGMKAGSPVRIAGVDVGEVSEVRHTTPGAESVTVTMDIFESGRPVHRDATVKIRPRIFLEGNFFLDVRPGTPGAGEMPDGETIPVERTAYPVQFDEVLSALKSDTREDLRSTFAELFKTQSAGGGRAFNRSLEYQADAYRYSAIVSEALLGERPGDLADWIRDSGVVADALDKNPQRLRSLVTNFNRTVAALADRETDLRAAVRELPVTLREAQPAFDSLNAAFPDVREFASAARPGVRSTGPTVDVLLPLLRQLRGLVSREELRGLSADLRASTPSLARLARESVPMLEQMRPLAGCTSDVLVPWGDTTVQDRNFPATGPAHQEFAKVLPNLAGESRSFDANGQWFKVLGTGGVETLDIGLGGNLFGSTSTSLVGVNPAPDRTRPPLRPDVPCETQEPPDLDSEPASPPGPADGVDPSDPRVQERLERAREVASQIVEDQLRRQGVPVTVGEADVTLPQIEQQARRNGLFEQLQARMAGEDGR